jgi:antitoxin VapB
MSRETKKKTLRQSRKEQEKQIGDKRDRGDEIKAYLKHEVRPHIPPDLRGKMLTKREQEEILGLGPDGYPS